MSRETLATLNADTLIGYTAKRGTAWHYRADLQGSEPNHYAGPVPVEDVKRRLFSWEPVVGEVTATAITLDGVVTVTDPTRQAIIRPDRGTLLGIFKSGYRAHGYGEWLVANVERILDADLAIGSAGLLRGGAQAWVQIELADTLEVADGFQVRPHLTACTSLDGSLATTYKRGCQVVVCDNTLAVNMGEAGETFKVKHTTNSLNRLADARQALGIIYATADALAAELTALHSQYVSDDTWRAFVDAYTTRDLPATPSDRSRTMAEKMSGELHRLWKFDERVAPWRNSALGVVQATNTYAHHIGIVRGATRAERNMERALTGATDKADADALRILATV